MHDTSPRWLFTAASMGRRRYDPTEALLGGRGVSSLHNFARLRLQFVCFFQHEVFLLRHPRAHPGLEARVTTPEHPHREQPRVHGVPDGHRRNGHTAGHLHDGIQRIHTAERGRLDRHADDREGGHRRHHPREVRRPPGPGDDNLKPAASGVLGVGVETGGGPMRTDDGHLEGNLEVQHHLRCGLHGREVAVAAHDDADDGGLRGGRGCAAAAVTTVSCCFRQELRGIVTDVSDVCHLPSLPSLGFIVPMDASSVHGECLLQGPLRCLHGLLS
mmetsp:Transcript_34768/g.46962  ORF Transcript_34768/g.46962 Transcript_34768/m.46962 type:complete len:273 (-) Transcript_34768:958-1776(-)